MMDFMSVFVIIDKCLAKLDKRVKQHLINVGYISLQYARSNNFDEKATRDLVFAGYLHDIGIISTGKVDDLLDSEEKTLIEHSVLGYMYLKYYKCDISPDIILYHHVPYDNIPDINESDKYMSNIVNLNDRLDFVINDSLQMDTIEDSIKYVFDTVTSIKDQYSDRVYNEFKNILNENIINKFRSGEYIDDFMTYIRNTKITDEVYDSLLISLVYLIESKSILTAGHSHIAAVVAKQIAKLFLMDEVKQNSLYYAGILHDIGKIAVPDAILKKTDSLTSEEFVEIKKHAKYAVEILKNNIPDETYYPAIRHHENLNGTGYPDGFKELTLEDEVLRVSDLIAALAENRYYRDSLPIEKVIEILEEDFNMGNGSRYVFDVISANIDELYNTVMEEQEERAKQYQNFIEVYVDLIKYLDELGLQKTAV